MQHIEPNLATLDFHVTTCKYSSLDENSKHVYWGPQGLSSRQSSDFSLFSFVVSASLLLQYFCKVCMRNYILIKSIVVNEIFISPPDGQNFARIVVCPPLF